MKVLLLDLTHGGEVLAREFLRRGCDVTAIDIYRSSASLSEELSKEGVRCLLEAPKEHFDLAVAPVHAPASFLREAVAERTITYHQAVGELASFQHPVVEVTGTRGKTSTVHVLSFLLSEEYGKVLSLSSSGLRLLGLRNIVLEEKVSIAPPTLLRLSMEHPDFDIGVFEVSLGGTGSGLVSVMTGLQEDYPIAAGTRRAYDGKAQMAALTRGVLVIPMSEEGLWRPLARQRSGMITFGPGGDLETEVLPFALGKSSRLIVRTREGERTLELDGGYLATAYSLAFSCALSAAMALGHDPLIVAGRLSSFHGAPGRAEVRKDAHGTLIRERNPGVSAASLEFILETLVHDHGRDEIGLVLDPVNHKVCEKLDVSRVKEVCDRFPQVTGRYVLPSGRDLAVAHGFKAIERVEEVRPLHPTVVWATKEGYL